MKNKLFLFLLWMMSQGHAQAPFGNEWIDYTKPHFRIPITQVALYRIPYNTLLAAIPGLGGINAAEYALYNNGVQIPIYISWTGTPINTDYIEFYGKLTNGVVDSKLYLKPDKILNLNASFVSDTTMYYLTFRNGVNKR